jgi:5-methyltetrahydropteroyltriglutamate--homocysteine methyltransferase
VRHSTDRFLTTHTGSLARSAGLRELLVAQGEGREVATDQLEAEIQRAVAEVVQRQVDAGLDVINDGDQSKTSFAAYVNQRLTGFGGEPVPRALPLEARRFGEGQRGALATVTPCVAPLEWADFQPVERDIANLRRASGDLSDHDVFLCSVSPGSLANHHPDAFYGNRQEYLEAIVSVMRREYEAIAEAGIVVQIDSPDLAQHSHNFPDLPVAEWVEIVAGNVAAINRATENIPREQVRVHVCWGAAEGPHLYDTELPTILNLLLELEVGAVSVVAANGRHEHEWRCWEDITLPEGMVIVPGVIDSTTNIVEHPKLVAERLVRFASVLGPENVIGGVDCGFGTSATMTQVAPAVAWTKLESLVEGAALASQEVFG